MAKRVTITISPSGNVHIDASGYHGKECSSDVEEFEAAIGKAKEKGRKPEYFAPNPRREKTTVKASH